MAAAQDDFEFDAVPKYMDFQNDENDGSLYDRSAFFNGDEPIHPTPHKPKTEALFNDESAAKAKTTPEIATEKIPVPAILAEKNTFEEKKPLAPTSDLALFNPGASRVKEKARRRSQQIQVQDEPKPAAPAPKVSTRRSVQKTPPRKLPFSRSREVVPPAAEKNNLDLKKNQAVVTRSRGILAGSTAAAEKQKLEENKKLPLGSNSNLALFNPAASRVQQRARRRSQQIQVKDESPKPAAAFKNSLRRPPAVLQTPPRSQAFVRSREFDPRLQASIDRLSMPKNRQSTASDTLRSVAGTPKKIAPQPILRRQNGGPPRIETSIHVAPKRTPDKPEAFKEKLRSYKPPSGKTPAKLTVPQPYPFHRSRSQCRDGEAKPFKIDPKVRESVNRLSAPRKRESAIGSAAGVLRRK